MQALTHSLLGRSLALSIIVAMLSAGCTPGFLAAVPGLPEYQALAVVPVPGGLVNPVGANFMIVREDLSLDTPVGEQVFGATYNSANGVWHWTHDVRYDGTTFVDPTGAIFDLSAVANGAAIPGSYWVKLDASTIKTKGGLAYHFDAQARVDHVNWISNAYPRLTYVWSATSVSIRQCTSASIPIGSCPLVLTVHLGPHGPTEVVDERSAQGGVVRQSTYSYDVFGRLETARTPFEIAEGLAGTLYEYGTWSTLIAAQTNSEGGRIEYEWEAARRLSTVTQIGEGNPVHRFSYELFTVSTTIYVVTHTNPRGGVTKYMLDGQRRLQFQQLVSTHDARSIAWHEGMLRPASITDIDGTIRLFPEWVDDDPVRVIEPSGNEIVFTYQPNGVDFENSLRRPIAQISDDVGLVSSVTYDAQGRPAVTSNGEGEATTLTYQGVNVTTSIVPWGTTNAFTNYGNHGHWVDAESSALPEVPIKRKFDPIGNPTVPAAGLQRGGILEQAYNGNRLLETLSVAPSDDSGGVGPTAEVAIERRSDGQPTAYRRPSGGDHELENDALGRVHLARERVDGVWQDTTISYDALGLATSIAKPNGMREEFDYDVYGRLVARRAFRDALLEGQTTFTWSRGHIAQSFDSVRDQATLFSYDSAGRLSLISYANLGETLAYSYDLRSRLIGETYTIPASPSPIALELVHAWDLADRETRLSRGNGTPQGELLIERDFENGRLASVRYGNGLARELVYDEGTLALVGFEMRNSQQEVVESTTLSREIEAGPTRLEFATETTSPLAHTREEYWLNRPGNLAQPEGKIGARVFRWRGFQDGVLDDERFFAWDELGNPASDADGDTFAYNSERNRLASVTGGAPHSYTYDEAGFTETRDGLPLAWTATGLLTRVGAAQSPLAAITWDMADRPISITVAGVTREFPLFGGMVEYDSTTGELGWLHRDDVSIPFVGAERIYRHSDFRGNTALVSDESGAIVVHKRYHPFGLDTQFFAAGYTEVHPTGFTGGLELTGTGLVWLGARILDSDVGRFLSPDPLRQDIQHYTYALGNPVWFWDPDGREGVLNAALGAAQVTVGLLGIGFAALTLVFLATSTAPIAFSALALGVVGASVTGAGASFAVYAGFQRLFGSTPNGGRTPGRWSGPHGQRKEVEMKGDPSEAALAFPALLALKSSSSTLAGGTGSSVGTHGGGAAVQVCASGPRSMLAAREDSRWQWLVVLFIGLLLLIRRRREATDE